MTAARAGVSVRFLIDGYNVTMCDPATRGLSAGEQRSALARRLGARGRELLGRGTVVIVWDGRSDGHGATSGPVTERYSGDVSADEMIVALVRSGDTVVTSDREVAEAAVARGAQARAADAVFDGAAVVRPRRRRLPSEVGVPKGANLITEEMKGIWLDGEE